MTKSTDALQLPVTIGRYQLLNAIASGGAATVYLARMLGKAGFQRRVAVKVLHRHLASDPEFVAGFLDEARLAARIHHPNVVDVYDVDAIKGRLIIVMKYVEGSSFSYMLSRIKKKMPRSPIGAVTKVVHDALMGLHAAHELTSSSGAPLGLIHRDFSPQNVLIGVDGVAHVTDFGIAKARGRMNTTQNQQVVKGKLRYLAPEQVQRGSLDRRVDVFAAGIMLWEALTGEALFDAEVDAAVLGQVLSAEIQPPSDFRADVSAELDMVVMRALERKPDDRFLSALDFAEAIDEAVGDQFVRPRRLGELVQQLAAKRLDKARAAMMSAADSDEVRPSSDIIQEFASDETELEAATDAHALEEDLRSATTKPPDASEPPPPPSEDAPERASSTDGGPVGEVESTSRPSPPGAVVVDEPDAVLPLKSPSRTPLLVGAVAAVAVGVLGAFAFLSGADEGASNPPAASSSSGHSSREAPAEPPATEKDMPKVPATGTPSTRPAPRPSAVATATTSSPAQPPRAPARPVPKVPPPPAKPPPSKKIFIPGDI